MKMKTKTILAAGGALLAFNLVSMVASFDDHYDAYSTWTPSPSTCLGRQTSTALGGNIAGDIVGAAVTVGSTIAGFPGALVGGLTGEMAYSVKEGREGSVRLDWEKTSEIENYCPPSLLQSKAYQR